MLLEAGAAGVFVGVADAWKPFTGSDVLAGSETVLLANMRGGGAGCAAPVGVLAEVFDASARLGPRGKIGRAHV